MLVKQKFFIYFGAYRLKNNASRLPKSLLREADPCEEEKYHHTDELSWKNSLVRPTSAALTRG